MVDMKLKVGDKVKVMFLLAGNKSQYLTDLIGMTGTVESVLGNPPEAVSVDFGFEQSPDLFFVEELELVP